MLAAVTGSEALYRFEVEPWMWAAFLAFLVALLLFDLLVLHREAHVVSFREAAIASAGWIAIGVGFTFVIGWWLGGVAATQYITAYVIEKSLSVDNVFVWAVIFTSFAVPAVYQHRVLFWGIFGALVMRAIFIFAGVALLERLEWLLFVFGGFLVFTAYRVYREPTGEVHPEQNRVLRFVRRYVPVTTRYDGQHFFTRENAKRVATPLFVVLVLVETTDLVFAVDSIPAIFAVTRDPFLVYTSNVFAILGLRSLFFLLAGIITKFHFLRFGLAAVLTFVGVKMLLTYRFPVPIGISLAVIATLLGGSVVASILFPKTPDLAHLEGTPDPSMVADPDGVPDLEEEPEPKLRDAI
jgi:tellurite resistance protein TerC